MLQHEHLQHIDAVCGQIATGRRLARKVAAEVRIHGLSEAEFRLLWLLLEQTRECPQASVPQSELVERLGVSTGQVSTLLERLRQKLTIQPQVGEQDRRQQNWQFTASGRQSFDLVVKQINSKFEQWCETAGIELYAASPRGDAA